MKLKSCNKQRERWIAERGFIHKTRCGLIFTLREIKVTKRITIGK